MLHCFKTTRNDHPEHIVIRPSDGEEEASDDDGMESSSAHRGRPAVRGGLSTHVDVRSALKTGDALGKTIDELNKAIKVERSTWQRKYESESESGTKLKKLVKKYDAGYQRLLEDRQAGIVGPVELDRRATALGTLLARAYGLATEAGWTDETKRRCKAMGDAYVYPSVFVNDLSSGLLIAKTLLGLILDVSTMAAPAHAVALRGTKIAVNLSYAVLQSFVTCCVGTVGSGTHQSKVVQETAHVATEFMPDQPTTSYIDMSGNEAPPPSLPHVKKSLRLVNAVVDTFQLDASPKSTETLLHNLETRRERVGRAISEKKREHPDPTGHQKLEMKRLGEHLTLIEDLLNALTPAGTVLNQTDDSSSNGGTDSERDSYADPHVLAMRTVWGHRTRLLDELAVGDRLLRANVQHHVGNGKWWRSMFNMGNGLASIIKAAHEVADSDASGYDFGVITAGLVSTALSVTQALLYRCTQGSASGEDHCAKIATLFALIGQTRKGDLRSARTGEIDPKALDKLVIGPRMTRMTTLVKALNFNSAVHMLAIIGHIKSSTQSSEVFSLNGKRKVPLTFLGLQREFNTIIKSKHDIHAFVRKTLNHIEADEETKSSVERLLTQVAVNNSAVKACKKGNLSKLDNAHLLAPEVMKTLVGSLQHAQHLYSGDDHDAFAQACDERLVRWGAETEIRMLTANARQISSKVGPTFSNIIGGNGSFFATKAIGGTASSVAQLVAGIDSPSMASQGIDLATAICSCCGPCWGSTSGYSYRTVKLKNEGRGADKEADVIAPPNSGIQKQGEHDFAPVFSLSTMQRQADNFDTLIPPFIAPGDMPPPFDYDCEVSVMRDIWEQMTKPQPLLSSKVLKKWAGPPYRKPGSLDPDPDATLGLARKRKNQPVKTADDVSSGSDSEEAYDIAADPKPVRIVKGTNKTPDEYVEGLTATTLFV
ncbi:hypothetical protein [Rhizobacter sp. SG703]|uniref:hypothetical protein n=1 Tax=Rhizobacter sp. SG703 TaxID=2587140 RepID=UPI001447A3D3|nr:hypothetical protein [Rhizobacter sp. SG703]NKI95284.1 hypothetical protein [Rhizobacter sp. SG703]